MPNYDFDLDKVIGDRGEELAQTVISELASGGVEVKNDVGFIDTGNLCFEVGYKGKPSGIAATDAKWWAHVLFDGEMVIFLTTERLRKMMANKFTIMGGDNLDSRLVLLTPPELFKRNEPKKQIFEH